MEYKIKFPIGDWSYDGHGHCEWFIVNSNKPVEDLKEIHLKCQDILGFDIGDICTEYGDCLLSSDIASILINHNLIPDYLLKEWNIKGNIEETELYVMIEDLIVIWLNILMFLDTTLICSVIPEENIPNIAGLFTQNRVVYTPGYGLFT